jgi:hypothetical protein
MSEQGSIHFDDDDDFDWSDPSDPCGPSDSSGYPLPEYLEQLLRREDGSKPSARQIRAALEIAAAMIAAHLNKRFPPHLAAQWADVRANRFDSPLCLLLIAAERCRQQGKTLNVAKKAALLKQLRPAAAAAYELFCATADAIGYTRAQVEASACRFNRIMCLANAFRRCAYPREIATLAASLDFGRRVKDWYVRAYLWSEEQLSAHVLAQFALAIGEECPDGPATLLGCIPRRRLATMTDAELKFAAANWQKYHVVVQYLRQRRADGGRDPELEDTLVRLIRDLVRSLTRRHEGFSHDEDDATVAIWTVIDAVADPLDGYTYEQDLVDWIKSKAAVMLARERRARQRRHADLPPDVPGRAERPWTEQQCDAEDLAVEALHLHAVCLGMQDQAERAWGMWIWEAMSRSALKDEVLAAMITLSSGREVTAEAVGVARCRIKRYLKVIDAVLQSADIDPPLKLSTFEQVLKSIPRDDARGRPPGDDSASRQIDAHVRRAIASAMASMAEGDKLMVWSSGINVLVETADADPLAAARTTVREMTRLWCGSGGGETGLLERDLVAERFERLGRWLNAVPGRLQWLRKRATALGVREILGAAVYLKIIQRRSTDEALNVLPQSEPSNPAKQADQAGGNSDLVWRYRCLLDDIGSG